MAPDNLTAYVLWDAFPGPTDETAAELARLCARAARAQPALPSSEPNCQRRAQGHSARCAALCRAFRRVGPRREGERGRGARARWTPRIRRMVGARLQARHVPRLEFRLDAPSAEEAALDATFERLAAERAAEDARRARAAAAGAPAGGPDRA